MGPRGPRRPVLVFFHGGAFVLGTSNVPLYDEANFAKQGVVFVSLNYRLGIEGFLKIPGVPSNLGIRDQLAALRWVQANIANLGGGPANTTVMGESAGAMSVAVLLASPTARGLFRRGIMMSGSGQAALSGVQASRIAAQYAKVLKIPNTARVHRRFTPEQLLAAQAQVTPKIVHLETAEHAEPTGGLALFFPVIDDDIVPAVPLDGLRKGAGGAVDMLVGYNSDGANYCLVSTGLLKKNRLNLILYKAARLVHPAPAALVAVHKKAYPKKKLGELFSTVITAYQFQVPSVRLADALARQAGRTHMYELGWRSSVAGGVYGAYHGLALVFGHRALITGPRGVLGPAGAPAALATQMQAAWVAFAKTGNPGWAAYRPGARGTMYINTTWQLQPNPHANEIQAWAGGALAPGPRR
ncbi:carboxylesterase family protein [Hymenobacter nivis]|uniref:Carboxylesterase n=1 Tax=Hymenobacter nivis TaxID=1850093 RepID=A0A2Z3GRH6_9BACT|nr:carboxylesterase family protein [Hymenobacter nivis]AWM33956.1 carboxylesterase [Hymenobacter nivis]